MSEDCGERKFNNKKRQEKAEEAIDSDDGDLVLCSLTTEIKKENVKKKAQFTEDVKQPLEAGKMCIIKGDTFFLFTKNTWIGDSSASCHIMKDHTGLFNDIGINELIQGSSGNTSAMKKGNLNVNIGQVDRTLGCILYGPLSFAPRQV